MIRAVTFDAGGTLIVPAEPVGRTYARIAGRFGIVAEPAAADAAFRRAFRAAPPLAFPGVADVARAERAWWRAIVRAALDPDATAAGFDAGFDAIYAHFATAGAWHVFPDVVPTLALLRSTGLRLAVVSNFDGRLPGLLAELGLAASVDAIVWSSSVGAAKPAAAMFAAGARAVDAAIGEVLHVGDDPEQDVRGARAAGATALLLAREGGGDLHDLRALPDRLAAQA